jgi:hypothetical protein
VIGLVSRQWRQHRLYALYCCTVVFGFVLAMLVAVWPPYLATSPASYCQVVHARCQQLESAESCPYTSAATVSSGMASMGGESRICLSEGPVSTIRSPGFLDCRGGPSLACRGAGVVRGGLKWVGHGMLLSERLR